MKESLGFFFETYDGNLFIIKRFNVNETTMSSSGLLSISCGWFFDSLVNVGINLFVIRLYMRNKKRRGKQAETKTKNLPIGRRNYKKVTSLYKYIRIGETAVILQRYLQVLRSDSNLRLNVYRRITYRI